MKLQVPFVQLPLRFDASLMAEEIFGLGEEAWRPHPQGFPGNSMLPLVAVDGDPANESFSGAMQPTPHLLRAPYLMQVMTSLGATIGRSRLMRLSGHAEVTRHADQGYYWVERVRVHVPVVTQATVRFECGNASINMAAGDCWIFDTWRQHRVLNDGSELRIHLVVDTVGGGEFWDLVAQGRPHNVPTVNWQPRQILPSQISPADLDCEWMNVPTVMSPWELSSHLGFLFSETVPHPGIEVLQQHAGRLIRRWKGLWARYGESPAGRDRYLEAFDAFVAAVSRPAQGVMLRNELAWFQVMQVMIGRVVVAASEAAESGSGGQRSMGDNA